LESDIPATESIVEKALPPRTVLKSKGKKGKRKVKDQMKAVVPVQSQCLLRSATGKDHKDSTPVIDVDSSTEAPAAKDVSATLFTCDADLPAESKLELLLSAPYCDNKYDKERLVAMFMVEETKDYPLLYIDVRRYKVQGWMSNHFVSCYYFLLSQIFCEGNIHFVDTSLWSNYIMGPATSDTVTPKAWVAKLQTVLSNKNINKDSIAYIPALVTKNHFICIRIDGTIQVIDVFDPLDAAYEYEMDTLVGLLELLYPGSTWTLNNNVGSSYISRQPDMHSCAFYVCLYAYQHAMFGELLLKCKVEDMKKHIMLSLVE